MDKANRVAPLLGLALWTAATVAVAAVSRGRAAGGDAIGSGATAPPNRPAPDATKLDPQQAMLWKYVARCALRADQALEVPSAGGGAPQRFEGVLGLAPEWRDGTCDDACQEKVSSCLLALTNRTGKHVSVSLVSAAPSLSALRPDENDVGFPYQEGAFFGNMFRGEGYACRGDDAKKGAQLKRHCALDPASCTGLAHFAAAGRCDQSCDMTCARLPDGTRRCAAVRCRDPRGRVWQNPVTIYLRDRIEAENADQVRGAAVHDGGLAELDDGAVATYDAVDFGASPGAVHRFVAAVASPAARGRIEVWLDGRRLLGALDVADTRGAARDLVASIDARGVSGPHEVALKFAGLDPRARLVTFALRDAPARARRGR